MTRIGKIGKIVSIFLLALFIAQMSMVNAATIEEAYEFPDVTVYTTVTITYEAPPTYLQMSLDRMGDKIIDVSPGITAQLIGYSPVYRDITSAAVELIDITWKVGINLYDSEQIVQDYYTPNAGETEESEAVSQAPPESTGMTDKVDYSISGMLGDATYKYTNSSASEMTTGNWTYNTAYSTSSYQYLYLKRVRSSGSNNVTVRVSYCDSLTGNIGYSNDTTNTTVFNEYVPVASTKWFRLDLETTNSTRYYSLQTNVENAILYGLYIFSLDTDVDLQDSRYVTTYLDNSDTATTPDTTKRWGKIIERPANYPRVFGKCRAIGLGWLTASQLEDQLYAIFQELGYIKNRIEEYNVTAMTAYYNVKDDLSDFIRDTVEVEGKKSSDIDSIVENTKEKSLQTITLTTSLKPEKLFDADFTRGDGIREVSNALIAAADKNIGKHTSVEVDMKNATIDDNGHVNKPLVTFMSKVKDMFVTEEGLLTWQAWTGIGVGSAAALALVTYAIVRANRPKYRKR